MQTYSKRFHPASAWFVSSSVCMLLLTDTVLAFGLLMGSCKHVDESVFILIVSAVNLQIVETAYIVSAS